jgi:tetratricopeptide (TPR) repeat protein
MTRWCRSLGRSLGLTGVLLLAAGSTTVWARHKPDEQEPDKLPSVVVQDLHYGDVLFHYWADDDSGLHTLTLLNAYSQWNRMAHHEADAQLLAAGLYLQLGMHNEAGRRFEALLGDPRLSPLMRNRAWFYLAKIWYERSYFDRSEQALAHIQGTIDPPTDAERIHLLANVLMRQGRFDEAVTLLQHWSGPPDWMAYARFNLGVALVRAGRLGDSDPILTAVGTLNTDSPELLNLRDKANLALGYAYLQADKPSQALAPLSRIRLEGPYSSRALLGDGWARAALRDYRGALTPWLALQKRGLLDAAVQESYLAVPYAYGQLGAASQAADAYEQALKSFSDEGDNLEQAIAHIHQGHLLDDLLSDDDRKSNTVGWFWQLKTLPDTPQSRYLYSLLADNDFQEGLKNWRDLRYLRHDLTRWDDSMDAFAAMIDTRERAYATRMPQVDAMLAADAPTKLHAERDEAAARLNAVDSDNDVAALGTSQEREQWTHVLQLQQAANALPAGIDKFETQDKLRLMRGVLYWRLNTTFKQRSYEQQRTLRQIDAQLDELQNRWARVQRARGIVPTNTGEFATRIAELAERIKSIRARLDDTTQQQSHYLGTLAESELQSQHDRLESYAVEARLQLAGIYDRDADQPPTPATPPAAPAEQQ